MRRTALQYLSIALLLSLLAACANIAYPTGGDKDVTPPKLVSIFPADSQLNTRVTRIEMKFDEFVNVNNASSEVQVSPILQFSPTVEAINKRVVVKIPDSLLKDNTTYTINFGNAIGDVHENNPFAGYHYIFSTGNYFDSLRISGRVFNAATGMNDTGAIVVLYEASKSDSAVVKKKPLYVTKTDGSGNFNFQGLPEKEFKIYALQDGNNNMIYDGETERVAFIDKTIYPQDSVTEKIDLFLFSESDSINEGVNKASTKPKPGTRKGIGGNETTELNKDSDEERKKKEEAFTYTVKTDTTDLKKRTQDINTPLEIVFNKSIKTANVNRVNLSYDSLGTSVESLINFYQDSTDKNKLLLQTDWKENTIYTLRLLKNFAVDSGNNEAMPSRHTFKTKNATDYAKLHIHLPTKYNGKQFLFVLLKDGTIFYQKPVTDTNIHFYHLQPAVYTMHLIIDKNENGKWDHGKLLEKIQPEKVIPHNTSVTLKAGWENIVDFEEKVVAPKPRAGSPNKRVAPR